MRKKTQNKLLIDACLFESDLKVFMSLFKSDVRTVKQHFFTRTHDGKNRARLILVYNQLKRYEAQKKLGFVLRPADCLPEDEWEHNTALRSD